MALVWQHGGRVAFSQKYYVVNS